MSLPARAAALALTIGVAACASDGAAPGEGALNWTAHGYLTPGGNGEPEIIGSYATEAECQEAVDGWMSRQVVGNPVSGECLPVDRR
jgi:hypothetical protein